MPRRGRGLVRPDGASPNDMTRSQTNNQARKRFMAQTIRDFSPLAPAVGYVPPYDRRRARAAGFPDRRPSSTARDMALAIRPRPPFACIARLLPGSGALGAYQTGVH